MINVFYISFFTFHADLDPLGSPDTHALWLQFCQMDFAGAEGKIVDAFFGHIFLVTEKISGSLDGDAPDFFFHHVYHLVHIILQIAGKR